MVHNRIVAGESRQPNRCICVHVYVVHMHIQCELEWIYWRKRKECWGYQWKKLLISSIWGRLTVWSSSKAKKCKLSSRNPSLLLSICLKLPSTQSLYVLLSMRICIESSWLYWSWLKVVFYVHVCDVMWCYVMWCDVMWYMYGHMCVYRSGAHTLTLLKITPHLVCWGKLFQVNLEFTID